MSDRRRRGAVVVGIAVVLTLAATPLPSAASVAPHSHVTHFLARGREEFCRALETLEAEAREKSEQLEAVGEDDPLAALFLVIGAFGDFPRDLRRLARKAPRRVARDLKAVADALEESNVDAADAISDPLTALAKVLLKAGLLSGPVTRIDDYARESCAKTVFGT